MGALTVRDVAVAVFAISVTLVGARFVPLVIPGQAGERVGAVIEASMCAQAVQGCICHYGPRAAQLEGVLLGLGEVLPPPPSATCGVP